MSGCAWFVLFFFFNDTATTEIYTLSLHDALPISLDVGGQGLEVAGAVVVEVDLVEAERDRARVLHHQFVGHAVELRWPDRKSTRLNSSHANISYAVFCLKKNKHTDLHNYRSVFIF